MILILIGYMARAQSNLDSLYSIWEDKTQHDSSRVNAFYNYIWDGFLNSQTDSVLVLAKQLFEFSRKKGYKIGMARALHLQGVRHYVKSDYPKALDYTVRSLKISEEIGDQSGISSSLLGIGDIYMEQGDYIKAIEHYHRSLDLAKEIGQIEWQIISCECLYEAYKAHGNGNQALANHEQMLVLKDSLQTEETAKKLQQMELPNRFWPIVC